MVDDLDVSVEIDEELQDIHDGLEATASSSIGKRSGWMSDLSRTFASSMEYLSKDHRRGENSEERRFSNRRGTLLRKSVREGLRRCSDRHFKAAYESMLMCIKAEGHPSFGPKDLLYITRDGTLTGDHVTGSPIMPHQSQVVAIGLNPKKLPGEWLLSGDASIEFIPKAKMSKTQQADFKTMARSMPAGMTTSKRDQALNELYAEDDGGPIVDYLQRFSLDDEGGDSDSEKIQALRFGSFSNMVVIGEHSLNELRKIIEMDSSKKLTKGYYYQAKLSAPKSGRRQEWEIVSRELNLALANKIVSYLQRRSPDKPEKGERTRKTKKVELDQGRTDKLPDHEDTTDAFKHGKRMRWTDRASDASFKPRGMFKIVNLKSDKPLDERTLYVLATAGASPSTMGQTPMGKHMPVFKPPSSVSLEKTIAILSTAAAVQESARYAIARVAAIMVMCAPEGYFKFSDGVSIEQSARHWVNRRAGASINRIYERFNDIRKRRPDSFIDTRSPVVWNPEDDETSFLDQAYEQWETYKEKNYELMIKAGLKPEQVTRIQKGNDFCLRLGMDRICPWLPKCAYDLLHTGINLWLCPHAGSEAHNARSTKGRAGPVWNNFGGMVAGIEWSYGSRKDSDRHLSTQVDGLRIYREPLRYIQQSFEAAGLKSEEFISDSQKTANGASSMATILSVSLFNRGFAKVLLQGKEEMKIHNPRDKMSLGEASSVAIRNLQLGLTQMFQRPTFCGFINQTRATRLPDVFSSAGYGRYIGMARNSGILANKVYDMLEPAALPPIKSSDVRKRMTQNAAGPSISMSAMVEFETDKRSGSEMAGGKVTANSKSGIFPSAYDVLTGFNHPEPPSDPDQKRAWKIIQKLSDLMLAAIQSDPQYPSSTGTRMPKGTKARIVYLIDALLIAYQLPIDLAISAVAMSQTLRDRSHTYYLPDPTVVKLFDILVTPFCDQGISTWADKAVTYTFMSDYGSWDLTTIGAVVAKAFKINQSINDGEADQYGELWKKHIGRLAMKAGRPIPEVEASLRKAVGGGRIIMTRWTECSNSLYVLVEKGGRRYIFMFNAQESGSGSTTPLNSLENMAIHYTLTEVVDQLSDASKFPLSSLQDGSWVNMIEFDCLYHPEDILSPFKETGIHTKRIHPNEIMWEPINEDDWKIPERISATILRPNVNGDDAASFVSVSGNDREIFTYLVLFKYVCAISGKFPDDTTCLTRNFGAYLNYYSMFGLLGRQTRTTIDEELKDLAKKDELAIMHSVRDDMIGGLLSGSDPKAMMYYYAGIVGAAQQSTTFGSREVTLSTNESLAYAGFLCPMSTRVLDIATYGIEVTLMKKDSPLSKDPGFQQGSGLASVKFQTGRGTQLSGYQVASYIATGSMPKSADVRGTLKETIAGNTMQTTYKKRSLVASSNKAYQRIKTIISASDSASKEADLRVLGTRTIENEFMNTAKDAIQQKAEKNANLGRLLLDAQKQVPKVKASPQAPGVFADVIIETADKRWGVLRIKEPAKKGFSLWRGMGTFAILDGNNKLVAKFKPQTPTVKGAFYSQLVFAHSKKNPSVPRVASVDVAPNRMDAASVDQTVIPFYNRLVANYGPTAGTQYLGLEGYDTSQQEAIIAAARSRGINDAVFGNATVRTSDFIPDFTYFMGLWNPYENGIPIQIKKFTDVQIGVLIMSLIERETALMDRKYSDVLRPTMTKLINLPSAEFDLGGG
jgi:hypothetical protein